MDPQDILNSIEDFLVNNYSSEFDYTKDELEQMLDHVCLLIERKGRLN